MSVENKFQATICTVDERGFSTNYAELVTGESPEDLQRNAWNKVAQLVVSTRYPMNGIGQLPIERFPEDFHIIWPGEKGPESSFLHISDKNIAAVEERARRDRLVKAIAEVREQAARQELEDFVGVR